ncbi:hypothetical protein ACET3Z_001689 [Daucus carota]
MTNVTAATTEATNPPVTSQPATTAVPRTFIPSTIVGTAQPTYSTVVTTRPQFSQGWEFTHEHDGTGRYRTGERYIEGLTASESSDESDDEDRPPRRYRETEGRIGSNPRGTMTGGGPGGSSGNNRAWNSETYQEGRRSFLERIRLHQERIAQLAEDMARQEEAQQYQERRERDYIQRGERRRERERSRLERFLRIQ